MGVVNSEKRIGFHMEEAMKIGFGIVLTIAVIMTGFFLYSAMTSKTPFAFSEGRYEYWSWRVKLYIGSVMLGWFAVITLGINSILQLFLFRWPDGSLSLAGMTALGSFAVASHLEQLPRMRRDYAVLCEVNTWTAELLRYRQPPSEAYLKALEEDSKDSTLASAERIVAATKLGIASALKARDENIEAAVFAKLERVRLDKEAEAERLRRDKERLAAEQAKLAKAMQLVNEHVQPQPLLKASIEQTAYVASHALCMETWRKFKELVVDVLPESQESIQVAEKRLLRNLTQLPGVLLGPSLTVELRYQGSPRDGFCDAIARLPTGIVPLYQGLQFEETPTGLITALMFAGVLPRKWSWGHGFYDRDLELVVTKEHLVALVSDAGTRVNVPEGSIWPSPGLRLSRTGDTFVVSSLAHQAGFGLCDVTLEVLHGQVINLRQVEVFKWGQGVLY